LGGIPSDWPQQFPDAAAISNEALMTCFVILLRAVNVGGTSKLPMSDLRAIGEAAGLGAVRTYIASGNMVAESDRGEADIKAALEQRLFTYFDRPVAVMVRTAEEMAAVLARNPFPHAEPRHIYVIFLDAPPPPDAFARITGRSDEAFALGTREIYVHYPAGMGRSKLTIPAAKSGTARNMATLAALAAMTGPAVPP
jgi:uncharacterized protein (DUF1697 family)